MATIINFQEIQTLATLMQDVAWLYVATHWVQNEIWVQTIPNVVWREMPTLNKEVRSSVSVKPAK